MRVIAFILSKYKGKIQINDKHLFIVQISQSKKGLY